jgi:hypothetical protein
MKFKHKVKAQEEGICGFSKINIAHLFLTKEANGDVHIPNYTRKGRDMRIKIANDTSNVDT